MWEADIDRNWIIRANIQFMLFIGCIAYSIFSYDTVHTYKSEKPQIPLLHWYICTCNSQLQL